jgi:hypothetical protein
MNLDGKKIVQVGIVVDDVEGAAKRYAELFGIGPWVVAEFDSADTVLHDKPLGQNEILVKAALADFRGLQIELLQPLGGPGTHREFAEQHGQGIHHISFGAVDDADDMLAAFSEAGYGIEMSGLLGGAVTFYYMATQKDLGTIFEFVKLHAGKESTLKPPRIYAPEGSGLINTEDKQVVQLGFAVEDADKMAKRYHEVFGVPFFFVDFKPPHLGEGIFHDEPVSTDETEIRGAFTDIGGIQFELLQPVKGPSTYREFLDQHGEGIHHLSFGPVGDAEEMLAAFKKKGYGIEMSGLLGGAHNFYYMDTQRELGTFIEFVKPNPGKESTLRPSGTYPPSQ